ncbi:hypothetical protein PG997_006183 [Apiospora hydei]|uniref:RING-type domain-containing protein n=1 Tax=Apiospora hydei TaxID=1337664 RepID=A0ABR1WN55_9PEZI
MGCAKPSVLGQQYQNALKGGREQHPPLHDASPLSDMEQEYDLLILTDATGSMHQYLPALRQALPKIVSVSCLTDAFSRWHNCRNDNNNNNDGDITREGMIAFAKGLRLGGGYDWDEAVKTGAAHAYSVMRPEAITLIMLYADAAPHMRWHDGRNVPLEQENLKADAFGVGSYFVDWVSACRTLSGKTHAPKYAKPVRSQVFSIIDNSRIATVAPFAYLSHATQGSCFWMRQAASSTTIASLTMDILLPWMGAGKQGAAVPESHVATARLIRYLNADDFDHMSDEADERIAKYMPSRSLPNYVDQSKGTIDVVDVQDHSMKQLIQPRATPIPDFSKRYTQDRGYAKLVVDHLRKIIDEDITSITINPVFGSLWRTVCNDRDNPARNELLERFSAAEIEAIIQEVVDEDRFPCVFLDPTQVWTAGTDKTTQGVENEDANMATWTRADLLEIGRSCHPKILRRLGRALTRLSYVSSANEMPEHVRDMPQNELIRIPLALAKAKYQRVFWKALLHLVVPGTKLSGRAAAVLAALSIRMGIRPLLDAADQEMLSWKEKWNNLEVPETWNTNCISLLLDADTSFTERHKRKAEDSVYATLLKPSDRRLFERLVDYSLLKANMDTSLTARVGWHPDKTRAPVGPLVPCNECHFPRSVTIMAPGGICGFCLIPDTHYTRKPKSEALQLNVSKDDDNSTSITWVECCNVDCRAQYVVYDSEGLNVRAKCHFCRRGKTSERAPTVECSKCLSRIIWPDEYRPEDLNVETYECPACVGGYKTIVEAETTSRLLCNQNGTSWLLRNSDSMIKHPLTNESIFKTVSAAAALGDFADKVEVLPQSHKESLKLGGKMARNTEEIKACLLGGSNRAKPSLGPAAYASEISRSKARACGLHVVGPVARKRSALTVTPNAVQESGSWLYAWCVSCGHAKRFAERVCARGAPAELTGWRCDDCQPTVAAASKGETGEIFRECPNCGVATEKTGDCNHMTCVCGAQWCFVCGALGEDSKAVYAHTSQSHGGWYGVDGGDDEFELYDDDSEDEWL